MNQVNSDRDGAQSYSSIGHLKHLAEMRLQREMSYRKGQRERKIKPSLSAWKLKGRRVT